MIPRTFSVTVATQWIPTLYSILCPYEAAKILCPALCVACSRASACLQVMAMFQKGHDLGQDWYTASIRDSLQSPASHKPPSLQHCPHAPRFPALPCCARLQHCPDLAQPLSQQHRAGENPCVLEWLLDRFLLPHLLSKPSSAPSLAPRAIFLHYPWLRQPKQVLQQYWCLRWIPPYLSPPVFNYFFTKILMMSINNKLTIMFIY